MPWSDCTHVHHPSRFGFRSADNACQLGSKPGIVKRILHGRPTCLFWNDSFRSLTTTHLDPAHLRLSLLCDPLITYRSFDMNKAIEYRRKCKHFRTLIIGRANAGKTTLLKKVCNSIEDPEIFSPSGEKVIEFATESLLV